MSSGFVYYGQEPAWGIVAKKDGERGMLAMTQEFGTAASKEEIIHRCVVKCRTNAEFVSRWRGWRFIPIQIDEQVVIAQNGHIRVNRLHRNEVQPIVVVGG